MKKRVFILFLSFLVMSCSGTIRVKSELDDIESLLQASPDSALKKLQLIESSDLARAKLRARYALLYSMALDKNYIDIVDDSLTRVAVNYYSNSRDKYHAMLSWYSLGRVQVNANNRVDAIISFVEAGDLAETIREYHYLGLIYRNIGELYAYQNDVKVAQKYYSKSAQSFDTIKEEYYSAYSKYGIALTCQTLGQREKRDSLLNSLEKYCLDTGNSQLLALLASTKGHNALLDSKDNAEYAIKQIKSDKKYLLRAQNASYLMMAYSYLGQQDSSDHYRSIAFLMAKSPSDSARLFAAIYKVETNAGNYRIASHYQDLAFKIQNRIMNERESMFISNKLTDYHQSKALRSETKVIRLRFVLFMSALLFLLFLLFLLQRLKIRSLQNREKDRIIAEKEERIQNDLAKTDEILHEIHNLEKEKNQVLSSLATSVLAQMSMVKKWADAYYGLNREEKDPYRYLDEDSFENKKEIIKQFCSSLEAVRNDEQWFRLIEDWVNQYKDGIMDKARKACFRPGQKKQQMCESDYRTLLLMFAGLPDKAIAYFQDLSYGAVRMRRLRYRAIFRELQTEDATLFLSALS